MKTFFAVAGALLVSFYAGGAVATHLATGREEEAYFDGHDAGYNEGYDSGHDDGYDAGYDNGHVDGYRDCDEDVGHLVDQATAIVEMVTNPLIAQFAQDAIIVPEGGF